MSRYVHETVSRKLRMAQYRLLKQFRQSGYYIVQIDEFRRLFDIPKSYQMSDIDKRVLERIEDELPEFFKDLKITKLRGKEEERDL